MGKRRRGENWRRRLGWASLDLSFFLSLKDEKNECKISSNSHTLWSDVFKPHLSRVWNYRTAYVVDRRKKMSHPQPKIRNLLETSYWKFCGKAEDLEILRAEFSMLFSRVHHIWLQRNSLIFLSWNHKNFVSGKIESGMPRVFFDFRGSESRLELWNHFWIEFW